ncbi:MAG: amino acid ABC transporter permease, partial [Chloroflexi bacterium HGW-Chloroflexi-7]
MDKVEDKRNKVFGGKYFDRWWIMVLAVVALILILIFAQPDPYKRIFLFVREGIWTTVYITCVSFLLVMFFGLFVALGRLSKATFIRGLSTVYVEVIRGIPMLVQLIFWYFAFPSVMQQLGNLFNIQSMIDYRANATAMAILGLTVGYSAYMSEVYRAGIQSISKGQMEAARSLG